MVGCVGRDAAFTRRGSGHVEFAGTHRIRYQHGEALRIDRPHVVGSRWWCRFRGRRAAGRINRVDGVCGFAQSDRFTLRKGDRFGWHVPDRDPLRGSRTVRARLVAVDEEAHADLAHHVPGIRAAALETEQDRFAHPAQHLGGTVALVDSTLVVTLGNAHVDVISSVACVVIVITGCRRNHPARSHHACLDRPDRRDPRVAGGRGA